jgi:colicin import membrane protein
VPTPEEEAQQRAAEQKVQEQKAEAQRRAEEQRQQAEKDAAAKAEAVKAEAAKAEAERKAAADAAARAEAEAAAKAKLEADRKAQQLAQQRKASEQERSQREADLRAQMEAEEHLDAARSNGALAQYQAMIAARIERAWIRPPSAHPGINCQVHITQVPGGVVTGVQVGNCNGDEAVRQSISDAAYRASPLPAPPDPALFDRDVIVTFAPHD